MSWQVPHGGQGPGLPAGTCRVARLLIVAEVPVVAAPRLVPDPADAARARRLLALVARRRAAYRAGDATGATVLWVVDSAGAFEAAAGGAVAPHADAAAGRGVEHLAGAGALGQAGDSLVPSLHGSKSRRRGDCRRGLRGGVEDLAARAAVVDVGVGVEAPRRTRSRGRRRWSRSRHWCRPGWR